MNTNFWRGRRVFLTGHTGFKGAWLSLWLQQLGAVVHAYALAPPTQPSLYERAGAGEGLVSTEGDVRDLAALARALDAAAPEVILHLAAQSVVLRSYEDPVDTFATNVMGSVHLFEAVRRLGRPVAVVHVTTDKVYENHGWVWPYRETDALGGHDPYSNSKACAELVMQSYQASFFPGDTRSRHGVALASARAGNVIGGGDWTPHQLVPAVIAAAQAGQPVALRNPAGVRPWQHVLDCLHGYLLLAERLVQAPEAAAGAWNFGPPADEIVTVAQVAEALARPWGVQPAWQPAAGAQPHEAHELRLDASRAARGLGWRCQLPVAEALDWVSAWYRGVEHGHSEREVTLAQIEAYQARRVAASPETA
jgi:CDP-glucose 4,6-dehydratase